MTHPTESLLDVESLSFAYDGPFKAVLRDLSLTVPRGESVIIVGDNGSGKSTLGHLIAGLYRPSGGELTIAGQKPSTLRAKARVRLVSYMGQVSHLQLLTSSILHEVRLFLKASCHISKPDYAAWALRCDLPFDTEANPRDMAAPQLWRFLMVLYGVFLAPQVLVVDEVLAPSHASQQTCLREVLQHRAHLGLATVILYQRDLHNRAFHRVLHMTDGQLTLHNE